MSRAPTTTVRERLVSEIQLTTHNVLTHQREVEHATASLNLNKAQLERAKSMLAALDGEQNQYAKVILEPQTLPAVPFLRRVWASNGSLTPPYSEQAA